MSKAKKELVTIKENTKRALVDTQEVQLPSRGSAPRDKYVAPDAFSTEQFVVPNPALIDYGHTQQVELNPLYKPKNNNEENVSYGPQIRFDEKEVNAIKNSVLRTLTAGAPAALTEDEKKFNVIFWTIFWIELFVLLIVVGLFVFSLLS